MTNEKSLLIGNLITWATISLFLSLCAMFRQSPDFIFVWVGLLSLGGNLLALVSVIQPRLRIPGVFGIILIGIFVVAHSVHFLIVYKCKRKEMSIFQGFDCASLWLVTDHISVTGVFLIWFTVIVLGIANFMIVLVGFVTLSDNLYVEIKPVIEKTSPLDECVPDSEREFTCEELSAVEDLMTQVGSSVVGTESFNFNDWLRIAWYRRLDAKLAAAQLVLLRNTVDEMKVQEVSLQDVKDNLRSGIAVLSGEDLDGRPMLWQRCEFIDPEPAKLLVGMKASWLALDAALSAIHAKRTGICLVYDFTGCGWGNVPSDFGTLLSSASHTSHISRIVFLNTPLVIRFAFTSIKALLPDNVTLIVEMRNSSERGWPTKILCKTNELPAYLGGSTNRGDYFQWMTERLKGSHVIYHSDPF